MEHSPSGTGRHQSKPTNCLGIVKFSQNLKGPPEAPGISVKDDVMFFENPQQNLPRVVLPRMLFNLLFNYFGRAPGNKEKISQDLLAFLGKGTRYPYLGRRQTMHTPNTKQAPNTNVGHLASEAATRLRHTFSLTTSVLCPGPRRVTVTFWLSISTKFIILLPA